MKTDSKSAILTALLANLGVAIAKFIGFMFTGAASMLAESIHSVADTTNQVLLIWGNAKAKKHEDENHPFGYGRERFFWSFIVAMVIFSLGAVFALYEGLSKFLHPHEMTSPEWAVGILILAMLLEGNSLRVAAKQANSIRGQATWWAFIRQAKVPELPIVLLEDFGALLGLFFALLGVGLAQITGEARFDALGSIAIGILLLFVAWVLAVEMRSLLIGEPAGVKNLAMIKQTINSDPAIERLIHLRTEHLGPEEILLAAKLQFKTGLDIAGVVDAINALEKRLRTAVPMARVIYIEPDVYREELDESLSAES